MKEIFYTKKKGAIKRLRVYLFGDEIGWMENFGEKIGRKTFLECI